MGDALDHLNNRTKMEWHSSLNIDYAPKRNYRRTSIIGTIGQQKAPSICVRLSTLTWSRSQDEQC